MRLVRLLSPAMDRLRRVGGLVRLEFRSGLRLAAGLSACALLSLFFARFVLRVYMPLGEAAHLNVFCALGVLFAIPIVAGAFEYAGRTSLVRLLQAAPVSKMQVFGAKLMGAALASAAGLVLTGGVDALMALAAPRASAGLISDGLEWEGFRAVALGLGGLALVATTSFALILRNALGACLAGGLVGGIPAVMTTVDSMPDLSEPFERGLSTLVGLPGAIAWGPVALLVCMGVTFPLRGLLARSLLHRGAFSIASASCLLMTPLAIRVGGTLMAPAPSFNAADADVYRSVVSPDGSKIAVAIHHHRASQRTSIWLVDTGTYEVEALPTPLTGLLALLRTRFGGVDWSSDSAEVCVTIWNDPPSMYSMDVRTKEVTEMDYAAFASKAFHLGWTFERSGPKGGLMRASAPGLLATAFEARARPKVTKLRPWLIFYEGKAGRVHRYNGRTGETIATEFVLSRSGNYLEVSPNGEWILTMQGYGTLALYHVGSGRRMEVEMRRYVLTDRERPLLVQPPRSKDWLQVGLDDSIPLELECGYGTPVDLDGERWFCAVRHRGMFVLDAQGKVLHRVWHQGESKLQD